MKALKFKSIFFTLMCAVCNGALADLPIAFINEASLPYNYSPSNYENSESNYVNSISNYDNSSSNYDNSESNYTNSGANYENGINGSKRLILNGRTFIGYYVTAGNGTTNFFSTSGKRVFYLPKNGKAVFGGDSGEVCGVVATVNNQFSLALTEHGYRVLQLIR